MTTPPSSGWYDDPTGRFASRYWNGQQWTNQVNSGGANATDEPPSTMQFVPPAPGTESRSAAPQPTVNVSQPAPRSAVGTVVAVVLGIIAILVVVFVLVNQSGDDGSSTPSTEPPATEAPPSDG